MSEHQDLLERIRLRLDESFVGIGEEVAGLPPVDVTGIVIYFEVAAFVLRGPLL